LDRTHLDDLLRDFVLRQRCARFVFFLRIFFPRTAVWAELLDGNVSKTPDNPSDIEMVSVSSNRSIRELSFK